MIVAVVASLGLFWLIVPGEDVDEYWNQAFGPGIHGSALAWVDYEHGWPFVYLRRGSPDFSRWSFSAPSAEFEPWALVWDLLIAMVIVSGLAGLTFACTRRVKSLRQFSLSTVLMGFVVAALVLGWWRSLVAAADREQPLIDEIESLGGEARTGFVGPVWLRKFVGRNGLKSTHRVIGVRLCAHFYYPEQGVEEGDEYPESGMEDEVTPDRMRALLGQLPSLECCREITLVHPLVTDREMEAIGRMSGLRSLNVMGCKITDRGLRSLEPLTRLVFLRLRYTTVTDAGMRSIAMLRNLEELDLAGTRVTNTGLTEVGRLRKLRCLDVDGTKITDDGLNYLLRLPELETIEACDTGVTPRGADNFKAKVPTATVVYRDEPESR